MDGNAALSKGVRFRGDDSAAFASNWRSLLAVDAGLALLATVVGVVLLIRGQAWGAVPFVAGLVYGFFVGGRAARWSRLRRDRGL